MNSTQKWQALQPGSGVTIGEPGSEKQYIVVSKDPRFPYVDVKRAGDVMGGNGPTHTVYCGRWLNIDES